MPSYFSFKFFFIFAIILILQSVGGNHAFALDVKDVRFGVHSDKTRMVIELDEQTKFRSFMLPEIEGKPYRLVVDLPDFDWKAGKIKRPAKTNILDVRSGSLKSGVKRLVVDLDKPAKLQTAFLIPAAGGKPNRLVVDYVHISKQAFASSARTPIGTLPDSSGDLNLLIAKQTAEETSQKQSTITTPVKSTLTNVNKKKSVRFTPSQDAMVTPERKPTPPKNSVSNAPPPVTPLRRPLIVIDAGHGGADPGAIGAEKQYEKHVTLSAAKILKKTLEETGRYRVALTRHNDKYLKLYKRVSTARSQEADLFISLHADSIGRADVRGASIYTLSNKASDAQTAKLARRENQVDLISGVDLSHEDKDVANILLDLAMRDTMNQSKFFANIVVDSMRGRGIRILPRPHRFAGFAVLKAPDIPSVLMEMGFMSNRNEARLLSTKDYQRKIAAALRDSIDIYFSKLQKNSL